MLFSSELLDGTNSSLSSLSWLIRLVIIRELTRVHLGSWFR
ncbi:unnamed protein product [Brassica oleracea]